MRMTTRTGARTAARRAAAAQRPRRRCGTVEMHALAGAVAHAKRISSSCTMWNSAILSLCLPAVQPPPPELEQLKAQVQAAIDELGGRVVPKLSWSCPKVGGLRKELACTVALMSVLLHLLHAAAGSPAAVAGEIERRVLATASLPTLLLRHLPCLASLPQDAVWMSPSSSLACTNADEVLLLLRASDRVAHDICHAVAEAAAGAAGTSSSLVGSNAAAAAGHVAAAAAPDGGSAPAAAEAVQHCLALRRWYDLQPGREFRCFVRGQALVGASQRDLTQCFEFLKEAEERKELIEAIAAFHAKHIQG